MTTTLAVISDMHINSTVALCPDEVELPDGGAYQPSNGQKWINRCWRDYLDQVRSKRRGQTIGIVNGDAIETDAKDRSTQTISRNKDTILSMGADVLDPFAKQCDALMFTAGTDAHGGKGAEFEAALADDFEPIRCAETGRAVWYSIDLTIEGLHILISHHPAGGAGKAQTRQNLVNRIATDSIFNCAQNNIPQYDLIIHSHLHQYIDSYNAYRTRVIITPAWTFAPDYLFRSGKAPQAIADIGGVNVYCDRGKLEIEPIRYQPEARKSWTLSELLEKNC